MSLDDRLKLGPEPVMHGAPCSVGSLESSLPLSEGAALYRMMYGEHPGGPTWTARQIYDAVTGEGYTVSLQAINRHRTRKCRCFK